MVTSGHSAPQVDEFRLSFAWTRLTLAPLSGEVDPRELRRPEVVNRDDYERRFGEAREDGALTAPWPSYNDQGYWELYLENPRLSQVSGRVAYDALVPLRLRLPGSLVPPIPDGKASVEGLLHPWGVTLLVTTYSRAPLAGFVEPVEAALQLRRGGRFELTLDGASDELPLDDLATRLLDWLHRDSFGELPGGTGPVEPFSVFTCVRGTGARAEFDPACEPVAQLLHGVTSFAASWASDVLPALSDMTVAGRRIRPSDHVIYGQRRGRVIWAPDSFTDRESRSLGCQHRNLVLASAQLESLAAFILATAERLRTDSTPLKTTHRKLAKRAAGVLARAYVGKGTYRSGSLQSQIKANDWLGDLNLVRRQLEMEEIAA